MDFGKRINLSVRFLLKLCVQVIYGCWGFRINEKILTKIPHWATSAGRWLSLIPLLSP
jgi:hypothetical protein